MQFIITTVCPAVWVAIHVLVDPRSNLVVTSRKPRHLPKRAITAQPIDRTSWM